MEDRTDRPPCVCRREAETVYQGEEMRRPCKLALLAWRVVEVSR